MRGLQSTPLPVGGRRSSRRGLPGLHRVHRCSGRQVKACPSDRQELRGKGAGRHGLLKGGNFIPREKGSEENARCYVEIPFGFATRSGPRQGKGDPWPAHIGLCHVEAVQGRTEQGRGEGDRGGV